MYKVTAKFLMLIMLALALQGCMWQTVNESDMRTAARVCGSMNNVVEISANFVGSETVICEDRTKHLLKEGT
jgi:outer membrane lipoprotein-sorting protein